MASAADRHENFSPIKLKAPWGDQNPLPVQKQVPGGVSASDEIQIAPASSRNPEDRAFVVAIEG